MEYICIYILRIRGVIILDTGEGKEEVVENINIVVADVRYGILDGFKYYQSFSGIF
jgi:hypothetical protein